MSLAPYRDISSSILRAMPDRAIAGIQRGRTNHPKRLRTKASTVSWANLIASSALDHAGIITRAIAAAERHNATGQRPRSSVVLRSEASTAPAVQQLTQSAAGPFTLPLSGTRSSQGEAHNAQAIAKPAAKRTTAIGRPANSGQRINTGAKASSCPLNMAPTPINHPAVIHRPADPATSAQMKNGTSQISH